MNSMCRLLLKDLDLVRHLSLLKKHAEVLLSRLKGKSLLESETRICCFLNRYDELRWYYSLEGEIVDCNEVSSDKINREHQLC